MWKLLCRESEAQVFQTCLDAVSEYMQSLGLNTVTGIWPQTDCVSDGLDNAADY